MLDALTTGNGPYIAIAAFLLLASLFGGLWRLITTILVVRSLFSLALKLGVFAALSGGAYSLGLF